jgi:archaeosine synthase
MEEESGPRDYLPRDAVKHQALTEPPFYLPEFEEAFRFILGEYGLRKKKMAIFLPCAVKKPYSSSPSHRLFRRVIGEVLEPEDYQIIIFGTCGVVPAELELMYPYPSYHYMLGKCTDSGIKEDFLKIESYRLACFLDRTRDLYQTRIAYCIGLFREAMVEACRRTGVGMDFLLPARPTIERMRDIDCPFPDGSLSMREYIDEFRGGLCRIQGLDTSSNPEARCR